MAAGALGIANLIAQLLPVAVNTYKEIQQANADTLPPVEAILAQTDAGWKGIKDDAQAQLDAIENTRGKPLPPTTGTPPT